MSGELLKTIFVQNEVGFRSVEFHSTKYNATKMSRESQIDCSILSSDDDIFIALNPATRKFDISRLNKVTGKKLLHIEEKEQHILNTKLLSVQPHNLKKIQFFIDETLDCQDELFVVNESNKQAYAIDVSQLQKLSSDKLIGISFSEERNKNMDIKEKLSFKDRVKALHSLPPMPKTSSEILNLRAIPEVKVEQIVEVIEKDPILTAQIVSYANSAFFGQSGSVKSLKDAIFRVLGIDAVMNMALALSVGSTFNIIKSGPVGAEAVWKSSVYSASLMQRLSMLMPWGKRPNPGTAYLVGLLSDIGLLVIGHLFPEEYVELNDYIENNKDITVLEAEKHVLGINHLEVGKMVMRMWNMPKELISVADYFNNKSESGEVEEYTALLSVVKTLLVPHGLSFCNKSDELSLNLLEKLSLEEEDVIIAADEVLSEGEIIKRLVKQMCA